MNLATTVATENGMSTSNVPQFLVIPVGVITTDTLDL